MCWPASCLSLSLLIKFSPRCRTLRILPSAHGRACCFSNEMGRGEFALRLIKIVCHRADTQEYKWRLAIVFLLHLIQPRLECGK